MSRIPFSDYREPEIGADRIKAAMTKAWAYPAPKHVRMSELVTSQVKKAV